MPFLKQVIRAAIFDGRVYRAIDDSPEAMFRALAAVAAAGVAFGLGIRSISIEGRDEGPVLLMLLGFTTVVIGWLLWATIVYLIGTRLLRGRARHRDLMRSMGLAYGPGVLLLLVTVPAVGGRIALLASFWILAAAVIAVRETQGYGVIRAAVPTGIGWALAHVLLAIVFAPNPS